MEVPQGDEELSYSQNSSLMEEVSLMSQPMLESAIKSIMSIDISPINCLNVADMGCGVGPVPLGFVSFVIENVKKMCVLNYGDDEMPEIQIYMNDLPSNDFNLLFRDLMRIEGQNGKSKTPLCTLVGTPGSFYERLFPTKSLNLVHANYALHCLSQVPDGLFSPEGIAINKGNIYMSETSPEAVGKAYLGQFEKDLGQFLNFRSREVRPNGLMLFTFRGRPSSSHLASWQSWELNILAQGIASLVSQGVIEEEKLDSFNFPCFGASEEEIEDIVERQGSFVIESMKTVTHSVAREIEDNQKRAKSIAKFIRVFSRTLISRHFGDQVLDALLEKLTIVALQHLNDQKPVDHFTIILLLRKK